MQQRDKPMLARWRRGLRAWAAGLALGMAGQAQAAAYVGTWDPAFGGNFTNLGWAGSVRFDVPDACLALGSASFVNVECQTAQLTAATVVLYDMVHPNLTDALDFSTLLRLYDVSVAGGDVVGVDIGFDFLQPFSPLQPAGTLNDGDVAAFYKDYGYMLGVNGDTATLRAFSTDVVLGIDQLGGQCPFDGDHAVCFSETSPTVSFSRIPEPGALALTVAALSAAGAAARRRRQPQDA